jgi:hypothetical protein
MAIIEGICEGYIMMAKNLSFRNDKGSTLKGKSELQLQGSSSRIQK